MAEQKAKDEKIKLDSGFRTVKGAELKGPMDTVKDEFVKSVETNFPKFKLECYTPEDIGVGQFLMGGQTIIGLVKLSKSQIGGYYASIRVSRVTGTIDPPPFSLSGYIISARPYLQIPQEGEHLFGTNKQNVGDVKDFVKDNKNTGVSIPLRGVPIGFGAYLPYNDIQFVQGLVNKKEDEILKKIGLTSDSIEMYRVKKALSATTLAPLMVGNFKIKINIGSRNGYVQSIFVQLTNTVLEPSQQTITINDVFLWGGVSM